MCIEAGQPDFAADEGCIDEVAGVDLDLREFDFIDFDLSAEQGPEADADVEVLGGEEGVGG